MTLGPSVVQLSGPIMQVRDCLLYNSRNTTWNLLQNLMSSVSIAFAGFVDGDEIGPSNPTPEVRTEDVIDDGMQQYVALECALNEGSTPPPAIEWVQVDTTNNVETVLVEDLVDNRVRFIDNKQWVILETITNVIQDKEYFCQVTNKERFQTARGPITYVLNAGESLHTTNRDLAYVMCSLLFSIQ